jgi:transposase-like protein
MARSRHRCKPHRCHHPEMNMIGKGHYQSNPRMWLVNLRMGMVVEYPSKHCIILCLYTLHNKGQEYPYRLDKHRSPNSSHMFQVHFLRKWGM